MKLNAKRLKYHFKNTQILLFFKLILLINFSSQGFSHQEVITNLHSKIVINQDASLTVTESITVNAQHDKIRRGITRSFPTRYKSNSGANVVVDFNVLQVLLDGKECHYQIAPAENGKIVLFGDEQLVTKGTHTYEITYQTNRQLNFSKDWTELYFNVVGSNVIFPIIKAEADIYLPDKIDPDQVELYGYTGYYGQKGNHYRAKIYKPNICHFETTQSLKPNQGFTISVAFPSGMGGISEPTLWMKLKWFFKDNLAMIILLMCILLLLLIYFYAAYQIHQNKPLIIPLFTPPAELLPADCSFLHFKNFNNAALTATIVDLAVHGYLKIKYQAGSFLTRNYYVLIKNKETVEPEKNPFYNQLIQTLFSQHNELKLEQTNYSILSKFRNQLNFKADTNQKHIQSCEIILAAGITISVLSVFGALWLQQIESMFFLVIIIIVINTIAIHNLKNYTSDGQKLYAQIAGFRMFLSYTEKDRLERLNHPTITSDVFEKYLPYAIALEVDHAWTAHFKEIYSQMTAQNYQPNWFIGKPFHFNNFNNDLQNVSNALNKAITAPFNAPGYSSGRSGGGFSGGGGGGGGIGGR